ncbi:sensor histidine kinase [Cellulosimicrobium sp. SH8]|uniref:sensor histidine kinase n=1 Tax=Cellulosimicrobium sp. SH8 TaxID=2952936 RepID=UPI0021F36E63|nr:histidine kinase [Cellulosimicrobium sp. SH8]
MSLRPARGDVLVATAAALALLPVTCVVALESLPAARAWALVALAALAHVTFVARRSAPVLSHVLVALTAAGMLAVSGLYFLLPSAAVFLLSVYSCTAWGPRPLGLVTGVVGVAATVLRYRVDPSVTASPVGPSPWLLGLLLAALVGVAWTAGLLRRSQEQVRREALAGRERAEAEREERAERAVLAERTRIAREMHDVVAHSLSVVVAQARVGRADPGRAAQALAVVEETGREALRDMRGIVHVLRAELAGTSVGAAAGAPAPTLRDVPDLVDRVRGGGRAVRVVESGVPVPLGPTAELAAFRAVQEALTNSARHAAPGSSTTVTLAWHGAGLHVEVADVLSSDDAGAARPAPGPDPAPATGAGLGLVGMRERIEAAGGTLEIRAGEAWTVAASVPASNQHALAPSRRADGGP